MKKSKRLQPVAKLADTRERDAARLLGRAQQQLKEHEERLQELMQYRAQYNQRFYETGIEGAAAQRMNDYHAFLNRLNDGIRHQTQRVQLARHEVERRKRAWIEARQRADVMHKAVDRHVVREQYQDGRKEQNETDEQARVIANGSGDSEE
jgi:flagellar FliJ protein